MIRCKGFDTVQNIIPRLLYKARTAAVCPHQLTTSTTNLSDGGVGIIKGSAGSCLSGLGEVRETRAGIEAQVR